MEPEIGDKIISLKNHWDYYSENGDWALTNGAIGTIDSMKKENLTVPYYISSEPIPYLFTNILLDGDDKFFDTPIDYTALTKGKPFLSPKQIYLLNKNKNYKDAPFDFAYAYAITCWKAQGSEWNKVLGFEEKFPFDEETHKKYLYTMITRAKEKLVLITKN